MLFHVCGFSEQEQEVIGMAFTRDKGMLAFTFTNGTLSSVIPRNGLAKMLEENNGISIEISAPIIRFPILVICALIKDSGRRSGFRVFAR